MFKPLGFAICPLVALAVVASGCGSTKTTTTSATAPATASTPATASATGDTAAPASKGAQTATQINGSTHAPQTTTAHAQTPVPTPPAGQAFAPHLKSKSLEPQPKPKPGRRYEFPLEAQRQFIGFCTGRPGNYSSKSSCECMIAKFEARKVEEGQAISEMLVIGVALRYGLPLSPRARLYAAECKSTI
jgi:hypothetical protein